MDRSCMYNPGAGSDNACSNMLDKIRTVDFALYDTVLYLDAYPNSREALEYYRRLKAQREELIAKYEQTCGPVTPFGNTSSNEWSWVNNTWPWYPEANK